MTRTTTKKMAKMMISPEDVERMRSMVLTIRELRIINLMRDYEAIRERSFGTSIPPVEDISVIILSKREMVRASAGMDGIGICCAGFAGKLTVPRIIAIADDIDSVTTRLTLLHEMAHLKVNIKYRRLMGHGKIWIAEMHRLVRAGEMDDWF